MNSMVTDSIPILTIRYWPSTVFPSAAEHVAPLQSLSAASLPPPGRSTNPISLRGIGGGGGGGAGPIGPTGSVFSARGGAGGGAGGAFGWNRNGFRSVSPSAGI